MESLDSRNILHLLERAAADFPLNGITSFGGSDSRFLSHQDLFDRSAAESKAIQGLLNLNDTGNRVVVLHTDDHLEGISWFWAIVAAGGLPCVSPPFSNILEQRHKQIHNLYRLFNNPIFLTNDQLRSKFESVDDLTLFTFSEINASRGRFECRAKDGILPGFCQRPDDNAVLMMTSGSTGEAKAVALKHRHILASVKGKSGAHQTTEDDRFLNWTGLDHVANLAEIHLHALHLGADQFHMPAANFLSNPGMFLQCISSNHISYTFAPNFFLSLLKDDLERNNFGNTTHDIEQQHENVETDFKMGTKSLSWKKSLSIARELAMDLSCLKALISGGEANVVATCVSLTNMLAAFRAPESFIRPGFGMTETCAGSIYNIWDCPKYDVEHGLQFACLGKGIPDMKMRISHAGELELYGSMIFEEYYNDPVNTALAFSADGWFRTGDKGTLTKNGRLCLIGRGKDMVNINGVSIDPRAIENAIEDTKIPFVAPTFTVAFAFRPGNSSTETLVVVYLLDSSAINPFIRVSAANAISKAVVTFCGVRPYKIISLLPEQLQKSSLGKVSRSKLRKCFESGGYAAQIGADENAFANFGEIGYEPPTTTVQSAILDSYETVFDSGAMKLGLSHDLLQIGLSSIELLRLKMHLQNSLEIADIQITTFFSFPVIKDLATHLERQLHKKAVYLPIHAPVYDPVVVLQPHGNKTPIFLFHPGLGEVLVFMNLARHITDRPVYALRARGFDNEPFFANLEEAVATYQTAIKRVQPEGPYAFAGYSFGTFLAFEITKNLTATGDEVAFLASFDQMPFTKERARTYDWTLCVLSVAFFFDLMKEDYAYSILPTMRKRTNAEVLDQILGLAPAARIQELSLTKEKLDRYARVALNFKTTTMDYDPEPGVKHMDVFYTEPLVGLVKAKDTKDWRENYIGRWDEVVDDAKYVYVPGGHRKLLSPPHLDGFQKALKKALEDRGL